MVLCLSSKNTDMLKAFADKLACIQDKQAALQIKLDEIVSNTAILPATVAKAVKSLEAARKNAAERVETSVATVLNKFSEQLQTAGKENASWTVNEIKSRLDDIRKLMEDYHKIQVSVSVEVKANTIANTQAIEDFRKDRTETDSKIMDRLFEVDRAFGNMKDLIGEVET